MFNLGSVKRLISKPKIAIVNITGAIDSQQTAKVKRALSRVDLDLTKAVALVINSPGGSPVQCQIITDKVKNFCKDNHLPLYTFSEDLAASGGYFLLSIGDKVYVDQNSLVGSIGAIIGWVGFKRFLDEKKIETRSFTTQDNLLEHILSSVHQIDAKHGEYLKQTSQRTHELFIQHVESQRGKLIKVSADQRKSTIYNADVFTGLKAVELGLADGIGNYQQILYQDFPNAQLDMVTRPSFKDKMQGQKIKVKVDLQNQVQSEEIAQKQMTIDFVKAFSQ